MIDARFCVSNTCESITMTLCHCRLSTPKAEAQRVMMAFLNQHATMNLSLNLVLVARFDGKLYGKSLVIGFRRWMEWLTRRDILAAAARKLNQMQRST